MKKAVICLILVLFPVFIFAQDSSSVLAAMQKNFARGSISTKIQVLQNSEEFPDVDMGPLYSQALEFILDNSRNLASDIATREMTILVVRLAGINGYSESSSMMWDLFDIYDDTQVKIEILGALGSTDPGVKVVTGLNNWLKLQNDKFRSGTSVEKSVVAEAVVTLGEFGDSSSFSIVFSTGSAGYSDDITYKANLALKNLEGSYSQSLIEVIKISVPSDKLAAFKLAIDDDEMSIEEKGNLYKMTLETGLHYPVDEDNAIIRELRYSAVRQLARIKWADASNLVIEHFNRVIIEYDRGTAPKSSVLEAISCLGAMGTHEAANRLTLYLEYMNSYMENGQDIDLQISLAVIVNIGLIGDAVAFDHLLYSGYLDYPASVKKAAREALNNLKSR